MIEEDKVRGDRGRIAPEQGDRFEWKRASDATLIEETLEGDELAYGELMRRYAPVVMAFLVGRTRSGADAEDILQETFLATFVRLAKLRRLDRFGPWLLRIARNKAIDHERKASRGPQIIALNDEGVDEGAPPFGQAVSAGPDPRELAGENELSEIVFEEIGGLRERYRLVLVMRLRDQISHSEIARLLNLKESAVRMRLQRGPEKLRKALERRGIGAGG